MTTIYRAAASTETGLKAGACWTEDYDVAVAYTDNPGFGGDTIREMDADLSNVLDVVNAYGVDFEALAEALGYDDPEITAEEWKGNGWLYPWEESGRIDRELADSGYEWIRYADDFPEDAITLRYIG